jgi:hypothetical protein
MVTTTCCGAPLSNSVETTIFRATQTIHALPEGRVLGKSGQEIGTYHELVHSDGYEIGPYIGLVGKG